MQADRHLLTAYWIEVPDILPRHFGVSAYSLPDALSLLTAAGCDLDLSQAKVKEGVTVADLDPDHIVPNMGVIARRGVWYPNLNSSP